MELNEARRKYIELWGSLGSQWGINRTMAQMHAFLLSSAEPQSSVDIMQTLQLSRGNVNMNIRTLMDWGLVSKKHFPHDRKEYFLADKDMLRVGATIARERKKRELEPLIALLQTFGNIEGDSEASEVFNDLTRDTLEYAKRCDEMLELLISSQGSWLLKAAKYFTKFKKVTV